MDDQDMVRSGLAAVLSAQSDHVQFDRLFLFIDEDWNVRRSRDSELIRPLIRHPGHAIDDECVEYHRGLCGRSRYSLGSD